ncbi:MAG: helix-turn-helix domain-containing protein [Thermoplasmata archaeon]|nr:helix-turn-helix domain-containing protein [Thermoplasmata archaeon]
MASRPSLSPEERSRLVRQRSRGGPQSVRAAAILLAADGWPDVEIARRCGRHRQTVSRWRRRFLVVRIAGLSDASSSIRRGRIPEETLQKIVRSTVARPPPGGRAWSTRRLAEQFGVSHMTVQRLWDAYRLRPTRFRVVPSRPDPVRAITPWDVVGLSLHGESAAVAFTLRPLVPSDNALEPGRDSSAAPPPTAGRPSASGRVARAFAALAPVASHDPSDVADPSLLLRFLGALSGRLEDAGAVRIVATRPTPAAVGRVERWQVRHPRIEVLWATDLPDWRARTAQELQAVGRGSTPSRQFRGRAELTHSLARSLTSYRAGEGPFLWVARPNELSEGEAAYGLRYDLAVTGHAGFKNPEPVETSMRRALEPADQERRSARTILREYLRVRAGDRVTVESWTLTLGYANAFVLETLRLGGRPLLLYQDEPTYWAATTEVPAARLAQLGEHRRAALERTDAFVSFFGPSDRERFHSLPSATLFRLGEYQDATYKAAAKAGARAVQMAIGRVSPGSARMYGVEVGPWRAELLDATLVDAREMHRRARALGRRLARGHELTLAHPNGTRLALRLKGRTPVASDGTVPKASEAGSWNVVILPAGVVTVALDESFAEGAFCANVTSSCGISDTVGEFADGRWTFEDGRLVRFTYREGQTLFAQSYGRAGRGRDRPASLSIGLNPKILRAPLLEDQGLGTVSLNIGRSDHVGGSNRVPWWAWLFLRGSEVRLDGKLLLRAGTLVE